MAKRQFHKAAAVYARTLLELGSEKGILPALREEMASLREVFAKLPELDRALRLPALSLEKKNLLAQSLSTDASDLVKRLIRLLEIKGRLAFLRLEEERRRVKWARVISAIPLTAEQLQHLADGLSAHHPGFTYLLKNEVDPSLIAGFRIEVDDFVTDASLRHKLNALRYKLAA
jgi:F-type H+-transporting ATPase subunit delta